MRPAGRRLQGHQTEAPKGQYTFCGDNDIHTVQAGSRRWHRKTNTAHSPSELVFDQLPLLPPEYGPPHRIQSLQLSSVMNSVFLFHNDNIY